MSSVKQTEIEAHIKNVQLLLFEMAECGDLLVDKNEFLDKLGRKFDYSYEKSEFALNMALDLDIVLRACRHASPRTARAEELLASRVSVRHTAPGAERAD